MRYSCISQVREALINGHRERRHKHLGAKSWPGESMIRSFDGLGEKDRREPRCRRDEGGEPLLMGGAGAPFSAAAVIALALFSFHAFSSSWNCSRTSGGTGS